MAKKVTGFIKLQIQAGQANPAPPVGPALGQQGVNIMDFCKSFNAKTQDKAGDVIPVEITVYADRSFTFITKTPPASSLILKSANIQKEKTPVNDLNNKELEDKVDRLESLILELAKNVQEIPQTTTVQPEPETQQITLSNDEAYELILSINQIIVNIDQQQIRNKNIQKLQNQYLFFNEEKFKELLTIPDYTYSLQQLQINENTYVQNEFMKQNNFQWLKRIIENIFEIQITKNSLEPLPSFIDAMYNRQYTKAIIEYEKLNPNQKIFFKSSYELAQIYSDNQIFLENMI